MLLIFSIQAGAQIEFTELGMNNDQNLLFTSLSESPGYGTYKTLFVSDIATKKISQLTFFPTEILYLSGTNELQIQNRFGVFRSDASLTKFTPVSLFPSFIHGYEVEKGKIVPVKTSPNGKYLVYHKPVSEAFGKLMIYDMTQQKEFIVSDKIPLSLQNQPVSWAPNSKNLIYSKDSKLYYYSIDQLEKNRVMAETYRNFADGLLSNIQWDMFGNLFLVSDSLVYKIQSTELFTRALYSGFVKLGVIAGKIPFRFESNIDQFWISPDGTKILFKKSQQNIMLLQLKPQDFISEDAVHSLPFLYLPRNTTLKKVVWSLDDKLTLLAEGIAKGKKTYNVFRIQVPKDQEIQGFTQTQDQEVKDIVLSDDGQKALLVRSTGIDIYQYSSWKKEISVPGVNPVHAIWKSSNEIIIAGQKTVELYTISSKTTSLLTVSQPGEKSGFAADNTTILTQIDGKAYATPQTENAWKQQGNFAVQELKTTSDKYRAFLQDIDQGKYKNIVMIRDLKGLNTYPLFPHQDYQYENYPVQEGEIDFTLFNHGSRIRQREVALVFNAIESTEGLSTVLNILNDYNIRCTFFVNGEFIRRYPDAVKEIADSGHEVGSLFYANFNMTDARLNIDTDFIKKGLARNEDDYFQATGKELALIWHAPYYIVNSTIIDASREMNYSYVGRDVDSLDWVSRSEAAIGSKSYMNASKLIERIISLKQPGSIIPVELGVEVNDREDYLFQYLDILINALINKGYEIVPVSTLMENAK